MVACDDEGLGVFLRGGGVGDPDLETVDAVVVVGDTKSKGDCGRESDGETSSVVLHGPCDTVGTDKCDGSSSESDSSSHWPFVLGREGVAGGLPFSVPKAEGGARIRVWYVLARKHSMPRARLNRTG